MTDLKNLEENHTYLISDIWSTSVYSITILLITKEAYKIRHNNDNSYIEWKLKKDLDDNYRFTEDITTITQQDMRSKKYVENPKLVDLLFDEAVHPYFLIQETCPVCNGSGTVQQTLNNNTTSIPLVTCPTCNGSKIVSKRVDIFLK